MKITVLDGHTTNPGDNPWSQVEALGDLTVHARTSADEVVDRCADSEVVLTNKTALSADTIARLPDLKYIGVMATGYNVVDLAAASARDIPVTNVPEYSTDSVAQHVIAMMLSNIHRPFEHSTAVYSNQWQAAGDFSFWLSPLRELADQTIGVIGYGRIGKRVCQLASAFGMNVLAHNPTYKNKTRLDYHRFDWCPMSQIFRESDFVSLHCPLTESTQGLVNQEKLQAMKPNAVLINSSRGALVNESDLAEALKQRTIAGACLDVVSQEPINNDNPLLTAPNCMITPHNAWATVEARRRLMKTVAENIEAFLGGRPINLVSIK